MAIAAISLTPHIAHTSLRGKCIRHSEARLCPVTIPTRADSDWNSMATRFATTTTHSSM